MLNLIILFTCIILTESIALYSVKKYSIDNKKIYLLLSMCMYSLIPILLYYIISPKYCKENISTVNIIWNILSTLYGLMIGVYIFSEHISSLQILGIILSTIGLIFIFKKSI
jgi:multidrug transporter EmrE-like cation transporter